VSATINGRSRVMVGKNIRFSMNSLKPLRNRPYVLNVKNADICFKRKAYASGRLISLKGGENIV
jgi:hypothetical protein